MAYQQQDFYGIRSSCLSRGQLYSDPEFPASDRSLYFSKRPPKNFVWKRPKEIVNDPRMFIDGCTRFDVKQGEIGNCWLLAAVANLTLNQKLFHQVVPVDQSFGHDYAGIFHFRFWQYGRWQEVIIDDQLPTYNGKLVFMYSEDKTEFWSALLEKAYAKLQGSYEALKGGVICEALEDFTGGVNEQFDLAKAPPNLFQIMLKAAHRGSLMGCSIDPDEHVTEARLSNGLIKGHAYSITKVKLFDIRTPRVTGKIPLVRLRNPWGDESEWKGAWSDNSQEWQFIPKEEKDNIGLNFDRDGEFWMSYQDFAAQFSMLEMTNLSPDSIEEDLDSRVQKRWDMSVYEGAWVRGRTAGGCRNFLDTFAMNPQYIVKLIDPDEDDDEDLCTIIIALMQKNRRSQKKEGKDCLTIGYAVYQIDNPDRVVRSLDTNFFRRNTSSARSPSFVNMREVSERFKLLPGTYCIVPSTFEPHEESEFILRVFTEKENEIKGFCNHQNEAPANFEGAAPSRGYPGMAPARQNSTKGYPGNSGYPAAGQQRGRPTVQRFEPFDPNGDAVILRAAMKGWGTDEDAIIGLLTKRTADQRKEIIMMYNTVHNGRDCIKDLKDELSGNFEKAIIGLMTPLPQYLARELHYAMDGLGTTERTLIEILCSLNNQWILAVKNAYYTEYRKNLVDDVIGDTSGDFRKLLISLCDGKRDEINSDPSQAQGIAQTLHQAGEGRWGTDEAEFIRIMTSYSLPLLKMVFEEYNKLGGKDFAKAIDSELSGNFRKGVKAIYDVAVNCPAFFAVELHDSMAGLGTTDKTLIRLVLVRSEIDMQDIKNEFQKLYNKTLEDWIKGDTSGDYKKLLLYLVEG